MHIDNLADTATKGALGATLEQIVEVENLEISFGEAIVQFGGAGGGH